MEKAKNDDERKRGALLNLYTEANEFLVTIDEKLFNLLQKHVGNVEENMTNHTDQLEQKEYFLLVAGRVLKSTTKRQLNLTKESSHARYSTLLSEHNNCYRLGECHSNVVSGIRIPLFGLYQPPKNEISFTLVSERELTNAPPPHPVSVFARGRPFGLVSAHVVSPWRSPTNRSSLVFTYHVLSIFVLREPQSDRGMFDCV